MNIKPLIATLFRALAFTLALTVLLPSVLKLSHTFNHHEHEVCDSDNQHDTHFHELDLECEFYKFKLTKTHFFELVKSETLTPKTPSKLASSYYISFNNHQQLTRFLRGPPQLMS